MSHCFSASQLCIPIDMHVYAVLNVNMPSASNENRNDGTQWICGGVSIR